MMAASPGHPSSIQVHDLVSQLDRCPPVRDDNHRGRTCPLPQASEDGGLDPRVNAGCRVVENKQTRLADQRPGQGDPLPLPAGQRGTPFADLRVKTGGQRRDKAVRLCASERFPHCSVVHGHAERDVAADRVVEQEGLLGNQRDGRGDRTVGEVPQIGPVHADRASVRIVEPDQQAGQRRLPRPGPSGQGHHAASGDIETHRVQRRGARPGRINRSRIGVGDSRHSQRCRSGGAQRLRSKALFAAGVQYRTHPAVADNRPRQLTEHPADRPQRECQDREQVGDAYQIADIECARGDPGRTDQQDHENADVRQRVHHRIEQAAHPPGTYHCRFELVRFARKPGCLGGFPPHCLDHKSTIERLVCHRAHLRPQLLGVREQRRDLPPVDDINDPKKRKNDTSNGGQQRIRHDQYHQSDNNHD